MKEQKMLMSLIVATTILGGANVSYAAEYEDGQHAQTKATVTFLEDNGTTDPVDPEDPSKPLYPVDPSNPEGAELMITYASSLNFGEQSKSENSWNALADKITVEGKEENIVPFVSTKDSRGTDRESWSLTVKQDGDFIDSKKNKLEGAELTFSNLYYANVEGAPKARAGEITLGLEAQEIASADKHTGIGKWSLGLGTLQDDGTTNGVNLSISKKAAINTDAYSTSITYELVADPAK
ncbi:hypothetical protein UAW_02476 [Enterococcus haemoperoxidus ATCC BAA-382]|uniref:WxL domain-containing protein n=1 Tax=Enterococcus haemoperoxidus ATCC BAA-382 TaxID=1158608 RepID=R2SL12_9ENTE|nr:WxL domain-containing protein [Enterococcus haemoperoxidus]EOH93526.1 hypothetical protein UAW_02476 [Enterococcus haemoperoxidus ATCC BAA-382]EOT63361.1 hypothetical protein I583_00161 [Enterococcus haemoperoxidus ATCC BAA-382]OJG51460.1 hypothetical protein RV06_GL001641 [Enterococcus haemoperoxidus]